MWYNINVKKRRTDRYDVELIHRQVRLHQKRKVVIKVMEWNGIGIGISDFKALRLRKNYFIDKTMFIKDIIDNQASVALITRPRRFGKTLNMSMLRCFFDCDVKDAKELFDGLKIMEQGEKYTSKLGAYPCIYMNLKDICALNYEEMIIRLRGVIKKFIKNIVIYQTVINCINLRKKKLWKY